MHTERAGGGNEEAAVGELLLDMNRGDCGRQAGTHTARMDCSPTHTHIAGYGNPTHNPHP